MDVTAGMRINAPAFEVFEAFVDPERIGNFWFTSSSARWESGTTVTVADADFAPEGFPIDVVEAEPLRIVFDWGAPGARRRVTLAINPTSTTTCTVTATESGWMTKPGIMTEMMQNTAGWVFALTCLKAYLENGVTTLRTGIVV